LPLRQKRSSWRSLCSLVKTIVWVVSFEIGFERPVLIGSQTRRRSGFTEWNDVIVDQVLIVAGRMVIYLFEWVLALLCEVGEFHFRMMKLLRAFHGRPLSRAKRAAVRSLAGRGVYQSAFRAFANWSAARQARCAFKVVSQTYRMNRLADAECHKLHTNLFSCASSQSHCSSGSSGIRFSALTNGNGSLTTALVSFPKLPGQFYCGKKLWFLERASWHP
jgi:hypothetical protein